MQSTYEETRVRAAQLGDRVKFLQEGMECNVLSWNDKASHSLLSVAGCNLVQTKYRGTWHACSSYNVRLHFEIQDASKCTMWVEVT